MEEKIEKLIALINKFIHSFNNFDTSNLEEFLSEDFEFKNISHGEVVESIQGITQYKLIVEQSKALFSNRTAQIQNLDITKTHIEALIYFKATMAISTIDGLRAGQKIEYKGSFSFTTNEDKITKVVQVS